MDAEIIRLHREGRRDEALRAFAEKYESRLRAVARRLLGDKENALDAWQEILIQVDRSLPKFRAESSLYTWSFRVAANVCLNYRRKHQPKNERVSLDSPVLNSASPASESPGENPDLMCRTKFRQSVVERGLRMLPQSQRAVLILSDLEEMTAAQVAEVLDINANAVKSRLHRARLAFRKIVDKEFAALGIEASGLSAFECTHRYLVAGTNDG